MHFNIRTALNLLGVETSTFSAKRADFLSASRKPVGVIFQRRKSPKIGEKTAMSAKVRRGNFRKRMVFLRLPLRNAG